MHFRFKTAGLLAFILLLTIKLVIPVQALAAEQADWNDVDWKQYSWANLDDDSVWESLSNWLETKASLKQLFTVSSNCGHAAFGGTINSIVYEQFCKDPKAVILALAKEDATTRDRVTWSIVSAAMEPKQFSSVLESIKLSASDYAKASEILSQLAVKMKELHGIDVEIPKTGDQVTIAVALLLFSCAGSAVLLTWKRNIFS